MMHSTPTRAGTLMIAASLLALTACGEEATPTPEVYESPTPSVEQGNPFTTTGTFAGQFTVSQYVEDVLSIFDPDDYVQQYIVTYSIVKIRPGTDENTLIYTEDSCITDMTEVSGALSTLNPEYYVNTPVDEHIIELSSTEIGSSFTLDSTFMVKGADLANPETDALPTENDDPRLVDFDDDGHPGYTVHVTGAANGDLYATERYTYAYAGTVVTNDLISGLIDAHVENTFVESTSVLIPTDTKTKPDEVAEHNFFELIRMDDNFTCQQLIDQRTTLFPQ